MIQPIPFRIPTLPLTALAFYGVTTVLGQAGLVPSPSEILLFLESLWEYYGFAGLFLASFLEGLVYVGLYFPGSFIIMLAVVVSDGSWPTLFLVSAVTALALCSAAAANYCAGRLFSRQTPKISSSSSFSELLFACLHPNILAFYFFRAGQKRNPPYQIPLVAFLMIPYGLALAVLFFTLRTPLEASLDNPYILVSFLVVWLTVATFLANRKKGQSQPKRRPSIAQ